jgi:hypothetical protein
VCVKCEVKLNRWSIEVEVWKLAVCRYSPKCWLRRLSDLTVRALNSSVCPSCACPTSELMLRVAGCQSLKISSIRSVLMYRVVWCSIGLWSISLFELDYLSQSYFLRRVRLACWRLVKVLSTSFWSLSDIVLSYFYFHYYYYYTSPRLRRIVVGLFCILCMYITIEYCCI